MRFCKWLLNGQCVGRVKRFWAISVAPREEILVVSLIFQACTNNFLSQSKKIPTNNSRDLKKRFMAQLIEGWRFFIFQWSVLATGRSTSLVNTLLLIKRYICAAAFIDAKVFTGISKKFKMLAKAGFMQHVVTVSTDRHYFIGRE